MGISQMKLISCIIPSYKRVDTLKRAINSVLQQTYQNIEVLVVDDNIPGDEYSCLLERVISSISDARVRLIKQNTHINGAVARNEGVKASYGEYIAFLDDDDEWLPTKLEDQMKILQSDITIDGIAGGATLWSGNQEVSKWIPSYITENNHQFRVLIRDVRFATSTFLCKKRAYIEMGGFNPTLKRSQDLQLFADFLTNHRIYPMTDKKTTKMYVDSAINRLDSRKLAKNKEEFFNAISDVMSKYSSSQQRRIRSAHHYEIAYVAIKENSYLFAFQHILLGIRSPKSLCDLYVRFRER